jgi:hypothetical protein
VAFDPQASGQGIRPNPKKAGHGGSIFELGINIQTAFQTAFLNQSKYAAPGGCLPQRFYPI